MSPTTISDETVDVAAKAIDDSCWGTLDDQARAALLAAVPYIEAGLRAKISDEIVAEWERYHAGSTPPVDWTGAGRNQGASFAFRVAARVARGTQGATNG